jgi:hypothetical protein
VPASVLVGLAVERWLASVEQSPARRAPVDAQVKVRQTTMEPGGYTYEPEI